MRRIIHEICRRVTCFTLYLCVPATGLTQQTTPLAQYIESHPCMVRKSLANNKMVIQLSAATETLFLQLLVADPTIQMRLLTQGGTLYVDPTGRKRERYALQLPSSADVEGVLAGMKTGVSKAGMLDSNGQRPDLTPLLLAMNFRGAIFDVNGRTTILDHQYFDVSINKHEECLVYSLLVPSAPMMEEKKKKETWTVGIYSGGGQITSAILPQAPGFDAPMQGAGRRPEQPGGSYRPQMGRGPQDMRSGIAQRTPPAVETDLNEWISFSLQEAKAAHDMEPQTASHLQETDSHEDLSIRANLLNCADDSLLVRMYTDKPEEQLSFLMQGVVMRLNLDDSVRGRNAQIIFPSAHDVKDMMEHHPNEVKPEFEEGQSEQEVRPDIRPLLSALNDTVANILFSESGENLQWKAFDILLDADSQMLIYEIRIPRQWFSSRPKLILVHSEADDHVGDGPSGEFDPNKFQRLSEPHRAQREGFGNRHDDVDSTRGTIDVEVTLSDGETP